MKFCLIDPQRLQQMKRDLADLEQMLGKEHGSDLPAREADNLA